MTTATATRPVTLTGWAEGERCEVHDLAYCVDCRARAGLRRSSDGTVSFTNDCAVATFAEITGASYSEAAEIVREEAGFRPSGGTPKGQLQKAFEAAGYTVREVTWLGLEAVTAASASGRCFYVSGSKGQRGHAWSLIGGKANRPYHPPFRYRLYEVTA